MPFPNGPIAAVTHPNPYPYYDQLAASAPFARNATLSADTWVAASAEAATAVLTSALCAVRPLSEPVPRALVGSQAGELFERLVRMSDGERHCRRRPVVASTLASITPELVSQVSAEQARLLFEEIGPKDLNAFALALPTRALGALLGIAQGDLPSSARLVDDLVGAFAPNSTTERITRGISAADALVRLLRAHCESRLDGPLGQLAREAERSGLDSHEVVANAVGLLTQAHEASAALIGNSLVALGRDDALRERSEADAGALAGIVAQVARCDPSVQNTRRFVVQSGVIAGRAVRAGEVVLVLLAGAERDAFGGVRAGSQLAFGAGAHACPGASLAQRIAQAGVRQLLVAGVEPARLLAGLSYRPSVNVRAPLFASSAEPLAAR